VKDPHLIHTVAVGPAGRKLHKDDLIVVMHAITGTTADGNPIIASRPHFSGASSAEDARTMSAMHVLKNICQDPALSKQLLVWKRDRRKLLCSLENFPSSASKSPMLNAVLSKLLFRRNVVSAYVHDSDSDDVGNKFSNRLPISKSNPGAFAVLLELLTCGLAACEVGVQEGESCWSNWELTRDGLGKLQFGHAVFEPKPATEIRRPSPLTDANFHNATSHELAFHLQAAGWKWELLPARRTEATHGYAIASVPVDNSTGSGSGASSVQERHLILFSKQSLMSFLSN